MRNRAASRKGIREANRMSEVIVDGWVFVIIIIDSLSNNHEFRWYSAPHSELDDVLDDNSYVPSFSKREPAKPKSFKAPSINNGS